MAGMEELIIMAGPGAAMPLQDTARKFLYQVSDLNPDLEWGELVEMLQADGYDVTPLIGSNGGMAGWWTNLKDGTGDLFGRVGDVGTWTADRLQALGLVLTKGALSVTGIGEKIEGLIELFGLEKSTGIPSFVGRNWIPLSIALVFLGILALRGVRGKR